MNEVFGVAGLVTLNPVFEHADVTLENVEASSELDAMGSWSWVFMAEIKQSPHVTEEPRNSIRIHFRQRSMMSFVHLLGSAVICWLSGSIWNWSRISALQKAPVLVEFACTCKLAGFTHPVVASQLRYSRALETHKVVHLRVQLHPVEKRIGVSVRVFGPERAPASLRDSPSICAEGCGATIHAHLC